MNRDIYGKIAELFVDPVYVLRDWIDPNLFEINGLYMNTHPHAQNYLHGHVHLRILGVNPADWALSILESHNPSFLVEEYLVNPNPRMEKLVLPHLKPRTKYNQLSSNTGNWAMEILVQNPNLIHGTYLSANPNDLALYLLVQNPDKIDWLFLSRNPNDIALDLLVQNPDKIDWTELSSNTNNRALDLLVKNPDKIDWTNLSVNPNDIAVDLLVQNPDKIDWDEMSLNTNPRVQILFQNNLHQVNFEMMSMNLSEWVVDFLQDFPDSIDWYLLSRNPFIFVIDEKLTKSKQQEFISNLL